MEAPEIPPLPSFLPNPAEPPARADLVSLKLRLAALLPPESGQLYWTALVEFVTGKINRQELGTVMNRVLGTKGEAVQLHNALVLSILYNTTRPALPSSSLRHSGWHKRQRDKDGLMLDDRDPKRRRIKAAVMALGKRERAEIKAFGLGKKNVEKERETENEEKRLKSLIGSMDSKGGKVGKDGLPVALEDAKAPSATLVQDYMRCLHTPLCCESKELPDVDTLKDRMSLLAYDSGLGGGADVKVAVLGVQAIESHLKTMVTSVISLVRANRANGIRTSTRSQLALLDAAASSTSFAPALHSTSKPTIVLSNGKTTGPLSTPADDDEPADSPLALSDFSSLFEISPYLLVQPHLGSIERLYALPPLSDSESSSDSSSSDEEHHEGGGAPTPSSSRATPSAGAGRQQYLIDPSAVSIPLGHPDVAHPRFGTLGLPPSSSSSRKSSQLPSRAGALLSPKSLALRRQLFPELDGEDGLGSPNNWTSTDGGTESDEASGVTHGRGREKVVKGGQRRAGRALFDVVDSRRLLDGVLD